MATQDERSDRHVAERAEQRWASVMIFIVVLFIGLAAGAGIHYAVMPQARLETVDPATAPIAGE